MSVAIKIENLSKQYRLGLVSTRTLSHDLNRWWQTSILGRDDPYLKIGQENKLSTRGSQITNHKSQITNHESSEYVWALKDINLEVEEGEVLGIIGKNGAGKSTLLKILSKVTAPTTGIIKARGRIASLLEVGTGFHPEMTGRENIYMNGAIMGMTKAEITRKLDEIVDFAGVERYIDTPVKRYSSGMTVRLGFSVAAHLEPEILVVDEVLAVGDAEFQKKAIGKMQVVSQGEGRTVLFVSHNMTAIANLCNNLCVLNNGSIAFKGNVSNGIEHYLKETNSISMAFSSGLSKNIILPNDDDFELIDLQIFQDDKTDFDFYTNNPIRIRFNYKVKRKIFGLRIGFDLVDNQNGITLFRSFHDDELNTNIHEQGRFSLLAIIPSNLLKPGSYSIEIAIGIHNVRWISFGKIEILINLHNINGINKQYADQRPGIILPAIKWLAK